MAKHNLRIKSQSGRRIEDIDLIEIAAHFFLKELDKIISIDKICVQIIIVDKIVSEAANEPLQGDMTELKKHNVDACKGMNYYICRLADYINSAETFRTLAHELIHVWQTENGSLETPDDEWIWNGTSYGKLPYDGTDNDLNLPWEVEADSMDILLTKNFFNKYFSNENE
jgi:hypothetical protein